MPDDGYVTLCLYLISDSYVGLDQEYSIRIRIDAAAESGEDDEAE